MTNWYLKRHFQSNGPKHKCKQLNHLSEREYVLGALFLGLVLYTLHPPFCPLHPFFFFKSIYNPSFSLPQPFGLSLSSVACKQRHLTIRVKFTFNISRKKKLLKHQNLIHLLLLRQMEQVVCLKVCVHLCARGILSLFTNLINSFHNAFAFVYIAVGWLSSFVLNTKAEFWHFANT